MRTHCGVRRCVVEGVLVGSGRWEDKSLWGSKEVTVRGGQGGYRQMGLDARGQMGTGWGAGMLGAGGWGGLEEGQQSSQGAEGLSVLDPKLWDLPKVALRPVASVPSAGSQLSIT